MLKVKIDDFGFEPSKELIASMVEIHEKMQRRFVILQAYYDGRNDILERVRASSLPNNKLVDNFAGYIVDVSAGYFLGNPVSYSANKENEGFQTELKDIFIYNDEAAENMEIAKQSAIRSKCFELLYIDEEAQVRFAKIDATEAIIAYSKEIVPEPLLGLRLIPDVDIVSGDEQLLIEAYTKNNIFYYVKSSLDSSISVYKDPAIHFFDAVPLIEFNNNPEGTSDFEKVKTLIDAYDKTQSDSANDFEYFNDAYLKIRNMSGTTGADLADMKRERVILVDNDGDADFLIKEVNDAAVENFKNRIQADIHKFSMTPDLTDDSFGGNISGVAIAYKMWGLEQKAVQKERMFKKALQRRIELICNFLKRKSRNYDWRDINIEFTRNMPQNLTEIIDMVTKLKGIVSDKTIFAQIPFIDDPQLELDLLEEQNADTFDLNSFVDEITEEERAAEEQRVTEEDLTANQNLFK